MSSDSLVYMVSSRPERATQTLSQKKRKKRKKKKKTRLEATEEDTHVSLGPTHTQAYMCI